jgi:hypothetical protein
MPIGKLFEKDYKNYLVSIAASNKVLARDLLSIVSRTKDR